MLSRLQDEAELGAGRHSEWWVRACLYPCHEPSTVFVKGVCARVCCAGPKPASRVHRTQRDFQQDMLVIGSVPPTENRSMAVKSTVKECVFFAPEKARLVLQQFRFGQMVFL